MEKYHKNMRLIASTLTPMAYLASVLKSGIECLGIMGIFGLGYWYRGFHDLQVRFPTIRKKWKPERLNGITATKTPNDPTDMSELRIELPK
jgi:hypothetical protein